MTKPQMFAVQFTSRSGRTVYSIANGVETTNPQFATRRQDPENLKWVVAKIPANQNPVVVAVP